MIKSYTAQQKRYRKGGRHASTTGEERFSSSARIEHQNEQQDDPRANKRFSWTVEASGKEGNIATRKIT